jgi:hypothetical protein
MDRDVVMAYPLRRLVIGAVAMRDNNNSELEYPPEDTLGDQWRRGTTGEWQKLLADSSLAEVSLHDRVSRLAYQLYLRRGKVPGHDLDDWFTAERTVLSRLAYTKNPPGDQFNGQEE